MTEEELADKLRDALRICLTTILRPNAIIDEDYRNEVMECLARFNDSYLQFWSDGRTSDWKGLVGLLMYKCHQFARKCPIMSKQGERSRIICRNRIRKCWVEKLQNLEFFKNLEFEDEILLVEPYNDDG